MGWVKQRLGDRMWWVWTAGFLLSCGPVSRKVICTISLGCGAWGQRPGNLGAASTGYGSWQIFPLPVPHSPHPHGDEVRHLFFSRLWSVLRNLHREQEEEHGRCQGSASLPSQLCWCFFHLEQVTWQREGARDAVILYNTVPLTPHLGLTSRS